MNKPTFTNFVDGFKLDYHECKHDNTITRNLTQPDADKILDDNNELRKTPGLIKDLSFGRLALVIPNDHYEMLKRKYPVLKNGSNEERTKFYKKFLKSSESLQYRVGQ